MRGRFVFVAVVLSLSGCLTTAANVGRVDPAVRWQELSVARDAYRKALEQVRKEHGGAYKLPAIDFFLFGMGSRDKYIYAGGQLRNALTDQVVRTWEVGEELIVPPSYTVALRTEDGKAVFISEDESAVWVEVDGKREAISEGDVKLPDFKGRKHQLVLRVLHQELLVNVVDGKPVPNFFVYSKPWYRDGAMMAMAFQSTGNLHVIKKWILGLREPYDRNNSGETEADNLGQALYLASLVSDKSHPLVPTVRKELARFEKDRWIEGRSDFSLHPVYQTKWAKFGLQALELDDPYTVPGMKDSYAALFWWEYKADDMPGQPLLLSSDNYPYLAWAACHYSGKKQGKLSDRDYPLTWEAKASQAKYEGITKIGAEYARRTVCAPHTWHAAEAFLYLIEESEMPDKSMDSDKK